MSQGGDSVNWSLFWISSALWIFFFEHFVWLKRFELMAQNGMVVPAVFRGSSKALAMITFFNLLTFLFLYGFKVSWIWSPTIVIGGYVTAITYTFATRSIPGNLIYKIGWLGMPTLSIYIWLKAFAA